MILFDFFKKWIGDKLSLPVGFFLVLLVILLVIIVPNLSAIGSKLGIKSKADLEKEVAVQQVTIKDATEANKELKQESDNQQAIGNEKVKVVDEVNTKKQSNDTVVKKIVRTKDNAIQNLRNKFAKTPTIKESDQSKQIAEVQINAVWETYCQFNDDNACPVKIPTVKDAT